MGPNDDKRERERRERAEQEARRLAEELKRKIEERENAQRVIERMNQGKKP